MPDAPAPPLLEVVQEIGNAIDWIDLSGFRRSRHAHDHENRPARVRRLVDAPRERGKIEASVRVQVNAPEGLFAKAEHIGGFAPGIMFIAGYEYDGSEIVVTDCA